MIQKNKVLQSHKINTKMQQSKDFMVWYSHTAGLQPFKTVVTCTEMCHRIRHIV